MHKIMALETGCGCAIGRLRATVKPAGAVAKTSGRAAIKAGSIGGARGVKCRLHMVVRLLYGTVIAYSRPVRTIPRITLRPVESLTITSVVTAASLVKPV